MKLAVVMGTRPNFVKVAPLLRAARKYPEVRLVLIHTGQHYDDAMSEVFFRELEFPPVDYNLEVGSGTHGVQTGLMLQRLDPILLAEKPGCVLVPGDTNSTLAGTLAPYKFHMKVGHIESGMREYTWRPEEMNKLVADHCSDYCFCPLERACENLRRENISEERIFFTGDITYDLFRWYSEEEKFTLTALEKTKLAPGEYHLVTVHRAETVDVRSDLEGILDALEAVDEPIFFPVHPRTKNRLAGFGLQERLDAMTHIRQVEPLGYKEFLGALLHSRLVLTDSSGVLKEAFYARKPSVVFDETTEYQEIFEAGASILAGKTPEKIIEAFQTQQAQGFPSNTPQPFGDGTAAEKMIEIVCR